VGFLDKLFSGNKVKRVGLTEIGKSKLENMVSAPDGIRLKILDYLESNGASTITELSNGVGYSQEKTKIAVNQMMRESWVQMVNGETK
jgi:hypothetical protein